MISLRSAAQAFVRAGARGAPQQAARATRSATLRACAARNSRAFATKKFGSKRSAALGSGDGQERLQLALSKIEASFGKGSIFQLGARDGAMGDVPVISTGSLTLDRALGVGGLPRGRVVEVYGPESSGKTSVALHVIAEAQRAGGTCAFIDAEHALDPRYAAALGVDTDALLVSQPDSGEQALEIADQLVLSGGVDVVVVDSVAALVPRAELEGEMGDSHVALQARLMSQAMRKLTGSLAKSSTVLIFINQLRSKVGVVFGSPEVTAGGRALQYYASVRLDIRRVRAIKSAVAGEPPTGVELRVKVVKNKMAPPFGEAHFEMRFGRGIDRAAELLDAALEAGSVARAGAWFSFTAPPAPPLNAGAHGEAGEAGEAAPAAAGVDPEWAAAVAALPEGNFAQGREKAIAFLDHDETAAHALEHVTTRMLGLQGV
eukprot:g158.t1